MRADRKTCEQDDHLNRQLVDDMVDAYDDWLEECERVSNSYARFSRAHGSECAATFEVYRSALDREERAADRYGKLVRRFAGKGIG